MAIEYSSYHLQQFKCSRKQFLNIFDSVENATNNFYNYYFTKSLSPIESQKPVCIANLIYLFL